MANRRIWNTSTAKEINEFWLGLGEDERRNLIKVEKDTVLRKLKEQQKYGCSCAVCGRRRLVIEDELGVLYDAYYEELEQYADHQQRYVNSDGTVPHPRPPRSGPFPGNPEFDGQDKLSNLDSSRHRNILTIVDDMLKNDGQKFLELMEQLAARRMQREEEAAADLRDDSNIEEDEEGDEEDEEEKDDEDDNEDGTHFERASRCRIEAKQTRKKQQSQAEEEEHAAKTAGEAAERAALMVKQQEEQRIRREASRKAAEEEKRREEEECIRSMFPCDLSVYITRDGKFPVAAGGFADIYQGTLRILPIKIKVALKAIKVYSAEDNRFRKEKRLRREIKVWTKLNHNNVLPLFGTASGFGPFSAMVCPWLENGTLTSYLQRCDAGLQRILALVHDVASGLQYLHSQSVVHGDLSGSNVLIRANGSACIADFGLSMVLDEIGGSTFATTTGKPRGTLRWAAPELLGLVDVEDVKTRHTRPTVQSDIYSFGGIMLQILSGKVPYHYYARDVQIVAAIFKGETPTRPDHPHVTDHRWEFIQRCWLPFRHATLRPSSEGIVAFSIDDLSMSGAGSN